MTQNTLLAFFISFVLLLSEASAIQTVYIYAGPGVAKNSLVQTENTVNLFLKSNYAVKRILPEQIIHDDWEKQAALFIIPGGADIPYAHALNGVGNQKIRSYVENGGAFLGICAGSYYAGDFVDFAKDTDLEVQGKRELSFFSGIVRGPILAPYDYKSECGARAAKIVWRDSVEFQENYPFTVYYNGGGYFVDANSKDNTTVLASYDTTGQEAAIIECQVGSGKAVLSAVHFEYDPNLLDVDNEHLKQIIPTLERENSKRLQLIRHLLERRNLNCRTVSDRLSQRRALFEPAFTHRIISTSQGNIALWDSRTDLERNSPTILFIHGHCANKEFFEHQLKSPLFALYRLMAIDLPGYGESDPPKEAERVYSFPGFADVVAELVNQLDINQLVVVGWSLGGHVALELTSRLPQLKGLLITGTPPIEISAEGLNRAFKTLDPKIFVCFGKGNLTYTEAQLLATISGYDFTESKEFLVDAILQTNKEAKTIYPRSIVKGLGQNQLEIVKEYPYPIAVIAGEQDVAINNDYIIHEVQFKNLWESKVHLISKGGHALFMECPDEFNPVLHRFLQDVFE